MTEQEYQEILFDAGVDGDAVKSGMETARQDAGDNEEEYAKNLLSDALDMLNHYAPEVEDLHFRAEVNDDGKTDIIVECFETDREEVYKEGVIYNMLNELEEVREEEEEYEEDEEDYDYD